MRTNQERAHELFNAARNLPSAERDLFLDKECGEDDALREEAESLLDHFLTQAKTIDSSQPSSSSIPSDAIEHIPDRWKISSGVKSGGMGSVYDAKDTALNLVIFSFIMLCVFGVLVIVVIGIPLLILLGLYVLVFPIIAAIQTMSTKEGAEVYRYPFIFRVIT